jgi:serine/threonine protein kinase
MATGGFMLGRYQVLRHLASGGMAEVLLARSRGIEGFERHVVVKRIHAKHATDEQVVKMFLDEARLAASLHHANIVQVHDIGQEQGEYFFAMEYVHGEDLRRLLAEVNRRQEMIPLEHVLTIVMSAAAALHYAHEHRGPDRKPLGLVHRDVSPANILVSYDGSVKVADFGIAKAAIRSTETHTGTLKGKISYMAPEQCLGKSVDRRSDVFALGIVLYEIAVVRRLFKASSEYLTMSAIVGGIIPKPSEYRADLPAELEAIMMKALAVAPEERFQSGDEMRQALESFAISANLRGSSTALADYMHGLFGSPPEPWLVESDDVIDKPTVDFDGDGTGLGVPMSSSGRISTPPPGSLLARARRKDASPVGIPIVVGDRDPGDGAQAASPVTASGTPLAWSVSASTHAKEAPHRRGRLVIAAAIPLAVLVVAVVVVLLRPGTDHDRRVPAATEPRPAPPAVPSVDQPPPRPPQPSPPAEVIPARPATAVTPEPPIASSGPPSSAPPSSATKPTPAPATTAKVVKPSGPTAKPAKPSKPAKPTTKTGWDPTSLLPD